MFQEIPEALIFIIRDLKKLPPYNPDFILKKYKINKRIVILEAHEKLAIQDAVALQQHYAFLEERGDQYDILL